MAKAVAKFIRLSPRKSRLVIDAIRGQYVSDALLFLRYSPQRAAKAIYKVVHSAAANTMNQAENDRRVVDEDSLKITAAFIDEGPRIKRVHPRAMGRVYPIIKPMCHITVEVDEVPRERKSTSRQRRVAASTAANKNAATAE